MTKFDYYPVWSPGLRVQRIIVHDCNGHELARPYNDGKRVSDRTRCGRAEIGVTLRDGAGRWLSYDRHGVIVAAGHAVAMDARFCRLCWPDGYEGAS